MPEGPANNGIGKFYMKLLNTLVGGGVFAPVINFALPGIWHLWMHGFQHLKKMFQYHNLVNLSKKEKNYSKAYFCDQKI